MSNTVIDGIDGGARKFTVQALVRGTRYAAPAQVEAGLVEVSHRKQRRSRQLNDPTVNPNALTAEEVAVQLLQEMALEHFGGVR
jgi:hypothetical protein